MNLIWIIVSIGFAILEIFQMGFFLIWFSIGALVALVLSSVIDSLVFQFSIFLVVSLVLAFFLTKPVSERLSRKSTPTGVDKLIGQTGIVLNDVGPTTSDIGVVKVDGEVWSAFTIDNEILHKDDIVTVLEVSGVKLKVTKFSK